MTGALEVRFQAMYTSEKGAAGSAIGSSAAHSRCRWQRPPEQIARPANTSSMDDRPDQWQHSSTFYRKPMPLPPARSGR